MALGDSSGWCSVRCLFSWQREDKIVYEERITLWHTGDLDEAIADAEAEAGTYVRESTEALGQTVAYLGLAQAYLLYDTPGQGAEVFSLMRTSTAQPAEYMDAFFNTGAERTR